MKFTQGKVHREMSGKSLMKAAAPIILSVATWLAPQLAEGQRLADSRHRQRNTPALVSPAVRPVVPPTTVRPPVAPSVAAQVNPTPAPVAPQNVSRVTLGGVVFEVERLTVSLATLDAQTQPYRLHLPDSTPPRVYGETVFPDNPRHYGNIVEVPGAFRAIFGRVPTVGTGMGGFGLEYERCATPCGLSVLTRDADEFVNALRTVTGQSMERVKIVIQRGYTTDSAHAPYTAAFQIAADSAGNPIRITTQEGLVGYPAFGFIYFTGSEQRTVGRTNFLLVEPATR